MALEIQPIFKVGGVGGWWVWPNPTIGLLGLWLVYKPNFNPISQVALEIHPIFKVGGAGGWWVMTKGHRHASGVMKQNAFVLIEK